MLNFDHLTCPACGELSDRPLRTFIEQPKWRCACGYTVMLPPAQVQAMLNRIEQAKALVRFSNAGASDAR
jgi:hypothetical protein